MNFEKKSKKSSKKSIDINSAPTPNFQLQTGYLWNSSVPKNNIGAFQGRIKPAVGYNRNDGTFSPIPPDFRYVVQLPPPYYSQLNFDWAEPSFDVDCSDDTDYSEDSVPQKIPMKNKNIPARNNDLQYQDINRGNDKIINQLRAPLSNKEAPNRDAIDIHKKNARVPTRTRTQSQPRVPIQAPIPAPDPVTQNNDGQYIYKNLVGALDGWLDTPNLSPRTKSSYRSAMIEFINILDIYGIFNPDQEMLNRYVNKYFEKDNYYSINNFRIVAGQFLQWISEGSIYNKIVPHKNEEKIVPDKNEQLNKIMLLNLYKRWYKTLKNDDNTNTYYKAYALSFISYLTKILPPSPTIEDIKTYFKSNPQLMSSNIFGTYKAAIKSFLKFIGSRGIPQHHDVYTFLDSNEPM